MAKLVVYAPGEPVMKLDLPPGLCQVGRSPEANFQINHPSVSSFHCQISVEPDGAIITDLGSTNGTWLEGQRIGQKPLSPGQHLRLGEVEAVFEPPSETPPPPPPVAQVPVPVMRPAAAPDSNYYESIPGAFSYPFKHLGILPLAVGSVLFLGFNALPRLMAAARALFVFGSYHGHGLSSFFSAAFGPSYFGIGTIFSVLCSGYVFLFMQTIITSSANGEDRMPLYPLLENWWYDAVEPYFRLVGLLGCCLAPAILCRSYLGPDARFLTMLLGWLGLCYFPMGLLAISVCDSFLAINPRVVIPSISRIPAEYGVYCLLFIALMGTIAEVARWILENHFLPWRYAIYESLSIEFIFLYLTVVAMRLLGLCYRAGSHRLAWRA